MTSFGYSWPSPCQSPGTWVCLHIFAPIPIGVFVSGFKPQNTEPEELIINRFLRFPRMTSKNVLKPSLGIHVSRGTWLAGTRFPPVSVCTSASPDSISFRLLVSTLLGVCVHILAVFVCWSHSDWICLSQTDYGYPGIELPWDQGPGSVCILYILAVSIQLISFLIGFDSAWPLASLVQAFSNAASTCDHRANINIRKGRPVPVHGHCPPLPLPGTNLAKTLTQGMIKKWSRSHFREETGYFLFF